MAYALAIPRGSGSFLHTQGQNMSWYQVILLDVILVYAAGVILTIWGARRLVAVVRRGRGTDVGRQGLRDSKGKRE